jgi:hypothetical protein
MDRNPVLRKRRCGATLTPPHAHAGYFLEASQVYGAGSFVTLFGTSMFVEAMPQHQLSRFVKQLRAKRTALQVLVAPEIVVGGVLALLGSYQSMQGNQAANLMASQTRYVVQGGVLCVIAVT